MNADQTFSPESLRIDPEHEADRITAFLRSEAREFKRQGAVVGLSGGVDSSVVGALCVRAFGAERVIGLSLPEQDSSRQTIRLSRLIIDHLGIRSHTVDITPILAAAGCYERRDDAIREVLPEYGPDWKCKIVLPAEAAGSYHFFSVVAQGPDGGEIKARLSPDAYLGVVAATNFKQRVRKMEEYYHADRHNYLVAGTPNRLEYDQGFFVKQGDGAADVKPIAHLYKTQVYQLAEFLGIPEEIRSRPPTTDTYSLDQTQQEFYFSLTYQDLDLCLYALDHGVSPDAVAGVLDWPLERAQAAYADIKTKRAATRYQHMAPVMLPDAEEEPE